LNFLKKKIGFNGFTAKGTKGKGGRKGVPEWFITTIGFANFYFFVSSVVKKTNHILFYRQGRKGERRAQRNSGKD
jgi:hypothetical protein